MKYSRKSSICTSSSWVFRSISCRLFRRNS